MPNGNDMTAASHLAFSAFDGATRTIEEIHLSIARRSFGGRPETQVVGLAHDGISRFVYGSIRAVAAGIGVLAGAATRPLPSRPRGATLDTVLSALGGVVGDRLEREGSPLRVEMKLLLPETRTRKIAVFVHGLCENESVWRLGARKHWGSADVTFASLLERDLGHSPIFVRFNSGLHVSENGRRLADLLERTLADWPHPVEEIVVVGHSMGGLVARSAAHYGHSSNAAWVRSLKHVICLGSPHLGAPLEKIANVIGFALSAVPETRPLGRLWNGRSSGIQDLRFGYVVDDDWTESDPDALLEDSARDVPPVPGVLYSHLSATITRDPSHPLGAALGDLLVRHGSASGRGRTRRRSLRSSRVRHIGAINHFDLLNHPAVYRQIRDWVAPPGAELPR